MEATGGGAWIIDLIALAFVAWFAFRGWRTGLARGVVLIGGLVVAIYCGARFAPAAAGRLGTALPPGTRFGIAFAVLFAVVMLAFSGLARLVGKAMAVSPLGFLDRAGGAALGMLKALLSLAVLGVVLAMLPISSRRLSSYLESRVVQTSLKLGGTVVRVVKPYVSNSVNDFIDEAQEYLRDRADEVQKGVIRNRNRI